MGSPCDVGCSYHQGALACQLEGFAFRTRHPSSGAEAHPNARSSDERSRLPLQATPPRQSHHLVRCWRMLPLSLAHRPLLRHLDDRLRHLADILMKPWPYLQTTWTCSALQPTRSRHSSSDRFVFWTQNPLFRSAAATAVDLSDTGGLVCGIFSSVVAMYFVNAGSERRGERTKLTESSVRVMTTKLHVILA